MANLETQKMIYNGAAHVFEELTGCLLQRRQSTGEERGKDNKICFCYLMLFGNP